MLAISRKKEILEILMTKNVIIARKLIVLKEKQTQDINKREKS